MSEKRIVSEDGLEPEEEMDESESIEDFDDDDDDMDNDDMEDLEEDEDDEDSDLDQDSDQEDADEDVDEKDLDETSNLDTGSSNLDLNQVEGDENQVIEEDKPKDSINAVEDVEEVVSKNKKDIPEHQPDEIVTESEENVTLSAKIPPPTTKRTTKPRAKTIKLDSLNGMGVTLTFETARKQISLGELRSIHPGYTFISENPTSCHVEIRANNKLIGYGNLVNVEGKIGVQILEFV